MTTKAPTTIKTGEVVTVTLLASEVTEIIEALLLKANMVAGFKQTAPQFSETWDATEKRLHALAGRLDDTR